MIFTFKYCYLIKSRLPMVVGAYLDCEHFYYLHKEAIQNCEIIDYSRKKIIWSQVWNFLKIRFGQFITTEYIPPASFRNFEIKAFPKWLPNIHHIINVESQSDFYKWNEDSTLSVFSVKIHMPFILWPFREVIKYFILKLKILIDLEDVAMLDRKNRLYGKKSIQHFLHKDQFILFKEEFQSHFSSGDLEHNPPEEYKNKKISYITDLDYSYVKTFVSTKYKRISGLP
ncbi:MAG: hypothetical protein KDD45_03310 [Bdellovibrionales bacterium]|nr:hypothetical protein [Bdellovibrionales bacterium]